MEYLPVSVQTLYADLVDRSWSPSYQDLIATRGSPYKMTFSDRDYWYLRAPMINGVRGKDTYIGPDSDEVRERLELHREGKRLTDDGAAMVKALRAARIPVPDPVSGKVLSSLALAGAFRLRAVVVGTAAFQTYSPLLGVRFANASGVTGDLDIAQFRSVSIAVDDRMEDDLLSALRGADPGFQDVPSPVDGRRTLRYALRRGGREVFSVDVLSPLRGRERERITRLDALRTDAQLLRYLDFLIYEEVNAVAVYGMGVPINVPAPERYAVHKLIVSQLRLESAGNQAKARKDLRQASELLGFLAEHRPHELKATWEEALARGPSWKDKLMRGLAGIEPQRRDAVLGL